MWWVTKSPQMQPLAHACVSRSRPALVAFMGVSLWLSATSANAILFYSTGDPTYNTTAPGGSLTNSGWQFEGLWGGFLGTPIAPKYFLTASHIGGSVGDPFVFRGVPYTTTAVYDDPSSDLRIWRICGTFPDYAQIYTNTDETNKSFVVFGRGTQRGTPVTTTNLLGTVKTNGWSWDWTLYDGVERWGTNVVTAIVNGDGVLGSGSIGEVLQAAFDAGGGPDECHLSVGDSAGGVFIQDGSAWKLAGINYAVDGPYNTTSSGAGFDAAIFDGRGLYQEDANNVWVPITGATPQPGSFYSTRVSAHVAWIDSVINGPTPNDNTPTLQSSADVSGQYVDEMSAVVDDASKTITLALPGGSRFYRLRACGPLTIQSIQVQGGNLVFGYQ